MRLIGNSAVAAIVGATIGAAAGLWSLQRSAPAVARGAPAPAAAIAAAVSDVPTAGATSGSSQPLSLASDPRPSDRRSDDTIRSTSAHAPSPVAAAAAPAASSNAGGGDDEHVLQRAQAMAQRPDVRGLLALRESVVRRAAERGLADAPSTRSQLDELDRRLNEARTLQLKLDAEVLRKAESTPPK